jgi:type IV secretion system protein VirB10
VSVAQSPPSLDELPLVGEDRGNRPLWLGLGAIALAGLILFIALETRREQAQAPAVRPKVSDYAAAPTAMPELYVPPEPIYPRYVFPSAPQPSRTQPQPAFRERPVLNPVQPRSDRIPRQTEVQPTYPIYRPVTEPQLQEVPRQPVNNSPVIVYEIGNPSVGANTPSSSTPPTPAVAQRARAVRTGNRIALVPQGSLISAVLETAIDSTQPGQARALVSANVRNLAGDKVLIPRGSRLYGDYKGELGTGQRRIQVQWLRLVRPDGVTIALDSPATDPLGRAGVTGRVNTHFLQILGGALLQSTIDIGTIAASRAISNSAVVVALPQSSQNAASQLIKRISVLVARDLDFSNVESGR